MKKYYNTQQLYENLNWSIGYVQALLQLSTTNDVAEIISHEDFFKISENLKDAATLIKDRLLTDTPELNL